MLIPETIYLDPEGGEGGSGGAGGGGAGDGGSGGDVQKQIDAAVTAAVEKATAGLKTTNTALKEEKKTLKTEFDTLTAAVEAIGGTEGLTRLSQLRESLEKDELGKLLADGKHEEWFEARTARQRADHENKLAAANEATAEEKKRGDTLFEKLGDRVLSVELMAGATEVKVESHAVPDAMRAAREVFTYDPELDTAVMRDSEDGIILGKDGKTPITPAEWLESQKKTSPHWWPRSKSGNATGSDTTTPSAADHMEKSFAAYEADREKEGIDTF